MASSVMFLLRSSTNLKKTRARRCGFCAAQPGWAGLGIGDCRAHLVDGGQIDLGLDLARVAGLKTGDLRPTCRQRACADEVMDLAHGWSSGIVVRRATLQFAQAME